MGETAAMSFDGGEFGAAGYTLPVPNWIEDEGQLVQLDGVELTPFMAHLDIGFSALFFVYGPS